MSGNIEFGIKLRFDGKEVDGGISISRDHLRQFAADAKRAGDAAAGGFSSAATGVRSISQQLDQAKNALLGYLTVSGAMSAQRWIVEQASAMQQLEARLKVATSSAAEFARAQAGVFEVANRWGAAIGETAGTFARLNPVIAQMGGTTGTTLKMMDGLAASLRLSGATAAETSSVLLQFAQAMGSGRVSGDEFRSMMENAEPMMRAVAKQMGKTTGELRQMAEEGKLTSSVFGNALLPAIDKLTQQAASVPLGISQAWQVLENNLKRDFGREFSEQASASAKAVKFLSDHTLEAAAAVHALEDAVVTVGKNLAIVAGGAAAGAAILSFGALASSAGGAAVAIGALNKELVLFTVGAGLQRLEKLSTAGKAGLIGMALWGGYEFGEWIGNMETVRGALGRLLEPVFRAFDKAMGIDHSSPPAGESAPAPSGSGKDAKGLSRAGEYGALVKELKWEEKLRRDHAEALLKIQESYRDKYLEASEKDRAQLQRDHVAAMKALLEQQKSELESLPGAKEGKAQAEARAEATIAAWKAQSRRVEEVLKNEYEQLRLSTSEYVAGVTMTEQAALVAEIAAVRRKLAAAAKESERIPLRERLAELEATLNALPGKASAMTEDLNGKIDAGLGRLRAAAGKALDPMEQAAIKFGNDFGAIVQRAATDGRDDLIEAAREAWAAISNQTEFDEAKARYEALFEDLKTRMEEIRRREEMDGDMLGARAAAEAVKGELLPQMDALISRMRAVQGENPVNAKTVAAAVGNVRKIAEEIDPVWRDAVRRIDSTFHDGFVRMLEGGKGSWKSFTESLKNTFKSTVADAIYQMLLRPFVFQAVANLSGTTGWGGTAGAANGYGNLVSTGSGLYEFYNGYQTGAGTGMWGSAGNWVGNTFGSYGAGSAATTTTVGSGSSAYTTAGMGSEAAGWGTAGGMSTTTVPTSTAGTGASGALAGAGWVVAAYMVMDYLESKAGGQKIEGSAFASQHDGATQFGSAYTDGSGWYANGDFRPQRPNPDAQGLSITDAIEKGIPLTLDVAGAKSGNEIMREALAPFMTSVGKMLSDLGGSASGLSFGLGFNFDQSGTAPDNISAGVANASGDVYRRTYDVGHGEAGQAIGLELQRMLLAAIKASDVEAAYKTIAGSVDLVTASAETLSQKMADIQAMKAVLAFDEADPFADYARSLEGAGATLMAQLDRQRSAVTAAAAAFNGSTASVQALAAATSQRYQMELQLAKQLDDALKATSAMFADTRRTVELSGLDKAGQYSYYDAEAKRYRDTLASLSDPALIQEYAGKLNQSIMAAWGTLDESQQVAAKQGFLARLDGAEKLAQDRYQAFKDQVKTDNEALGAEISAAANKIDAAADKIVAAASIPQTVNVVSTINLTGATAGAEVGGWNG